MSLIYSVDSIKELDIYLDHDHGYTHQGLYQIVSYYNNLEHDTHISDVNIRINFLEYDLDDLVLEYNIPDEYSSNYDGSISEYICDWLLKNLPNINHIWYLPFPDTYLVKLNN